MNICDNLFQLYGSSETLIILFYLYLIHKTVNYSFNSIKHDFRLLIKIDAKLCYYPFLAMFPLLETSRLIGNAINWLVSIWVSIVRKKVNKPSHVDWKSHSHHILQLPTSDFHFFLSDSHAFPLHNTKPLAQHVL